MHGQALSLNQVSPWTADLVKIGFLWICVSRVYSGLLRAELILLPFLEVHCQFPLFECLFSWSLWKLCVSRGIRPSVSLGLKWKTGWKMTREAQAPMSKMYSACAWFMQLIFIGGAERSHWGAGPNNSQMPHQVQQDKWKMRNNTLLQQA